MTQREPQTENLKSPRTGAWIKQFGGWRYRALPELLIQNEPSPTLQGAILRAMFELPPQLRD